MTTNPLTIEAVAEWCESKPADERYFYIDPEACALAQFLRDNGYPEARVNGWGWRESRKTTDYSDIPDELVNAAVEERTFGGLAARLREATP